MNKKQMVLAALMIGAITNLSQAQTFYPVLKNSSAAEKERLDKNYALSLNSPNNGTVESALAVVTMIKLDLPADEFPMIRDKIDYLAAHSTTPMIRYRACLAGAVFAHPAMFTEEAAHQYSDSEAFFSALADRKTKPLLSSK
ncbi:MAG: hypothetical protein ABSD46_12255 [Bacteroidota bacterium]